MFSIFPDLLTYGFFAPFLLRVALGIVFLNSGYRLAFKQRSLLKQKFEKYSFKPGEAWANITSVISIAVGLFLIFGTFTQIAALISLIIILFLLLVKVKEKEVVKIGTEYLLILLVISIALLLQGAGAFALDLPL